MRRNHSSVNCSSRTAHREPVEKENATRWTSAYSFHLSGERGSHYSRRVAKGTRFGALGPHG
jgi:hypothetical protein